VQLSPAESPAGAGVPRGWGVYALALADDPFPAWARLRERAPVADVGDGVFLVTSWEGVDSALRAPALRAGSGVSESFAGSSERVRALTRIWLMSLDGAEQARPRGLVRREFTPRAVEGMRPFVEETAGALARRLAARAREEPADLVQELAFALPSEVTRWLFRLPADEWRGVVEPLVARPPGVPLNEDPGAMLDGLAAWFEEKLRGPQRGDPESLFARLRRPDPEHGALSEAEIVANAVLLVTAAIDTTTALVANAVWCLLEHPQELALAREDPGLLPAAVEETLRFQPPALSCSRSAPEGGELCGTALPPGSDLLLCVAAANRDPARFAQPDRFDLRRPDVASLTFGGGRHFCLGAALARLEARAALVALLREAPQLELAEPVRWRRDNPTVRCPQALRVRCR
jgi:cytochrome P450